MKWVNYHSYDRLVVCDNFVLQTLITLALFLEALNQTSINSPEYFRSATPISSRISWKYSNSFCLLRIG